ncbi:MAG: hypothetical protein K2G38_06555 [Clostridia bacterium]|nr:hypothetical protein [Clostridia bacterium]
MKEAMVYLAAAGFLISVFPIYVYNYVYINTEEKYASINVTFYRYIKLFNMNTVKDKPNEMQINGKSKKIDPTLLKLNYYKMFNQVCVYKVIQLSDFGLVNTNNAYAALAQSSITTAVYKFLQINGNYTKLRNYIVLNEEHSDIRYYAKAVTIINLTVIAKIFLIFLMEKINERKN